MSLVRLECSSGGSFKLNAKWQPARSVARSLSLPLALSLTLPLHLASVRSGNELTLRPLPPCLPSFLALWANCRKILANRKRNKMQIYFSSSPFELLRKYNKQLFPLLFVFVERFKLSPDCALRSLCNQYKTRVHLGALSWPRRGGHVPLKRLTTINSICDICRVASSAA